VSTFLARAAIGSQSGRDPTGAPFVPETSAGPSPREAMGEEAYLSIALGPGGKHVIGGPESVAEQLRELHEQGLQRGIMLSSLDYVDGLERLETQVLPILRRMDLRR